MTDERSIKELLRFPLLFQDNRITRFYIGGSVMNQWRRMEEAEDSHRCEELLATSIGAISKGEKAGFGVSRTIDSQGGLLLSDILARYPKEVLGEKFERYNPGQLSVLARAGDTKVRLVMQCHLRRADARKYFGMPMGKTEAWYIARTREVPGGPCVYAGFRPHVTEERWRDLVRVQDTGGMLACLHRIPVRQGQTILIPAGMPHCVGPGCLFVEFHECNDVTIRVEKDINGMHVSDEEMYCGLSEEDGLGLFDYTTYTEEEIYKKSVMEEKVLCEEKEYLVSRLIGKEENDSFGVDKIVLNGSCALPDRPYHRVLVALDGDVMLEADGRRATLVQGHGALVPACVRGLSLRGEDATAAVGIPFIPDAQQTI